MTLNLREVSKWALTHLAPKAAFRWAHFASRLPVYFATDMAYQRGEEKQLGHGRVALTDDISMYLPSGRVANSVFRAMLFEMSGQREWREFLQLADGCKALVDVGASGGFFSTLFAASRPHAGTRILSIEPDQSCQGPLQELRDVQGSPDLTWEVVRCAIGAKRGTSSFVSSGYGGELITKTRDPGAFMAGFAAANELSTTVQTVEVRTLEDVCDSYGTMPDLLKIDIESFEHELLASSQAFLARTAPRLHLELHAAFLRERGCDPCASLMILREIGYTPSVGTPPKWETLMTEARTAYVLRYNFAPPKRPGA